MDRPNRTPNPRGRNPARERTGDGRGARSSPGLSPRPPLRPLATTLWEYPSQHYDAWLDNDGKLHKSARPMQGDKAYEGATPSWVIWQLLVRYTREKDLVVDPMCGSGTTLDVARDLARRAVGYDLAPVRPDIFRADARKLPLEDGAADFAFVDPPYSTHINYSDDPACIGKLDAADSRAQGPAGPASGYFGAMSKVIAELHRVLKPRRYMAIYVSDSWRKRAHADPGEGTGVFMPIGFELFSIAREKFRPVDVVAVARKNEKLDRANWRKAAVEGNFFLRGFNYLMIFKKV
jgi:DNA modification methylase